MELNLKQKEAVENVDGPLLVISGPGSGKTRTLVERAIYLLVEKGVKPSNILLSTFTEKAARELLTRISERVKNTELKININEMYIGTLHSIFLRIIDENIEYSFFRDGYKILDEVDQHFFIYSKIKFFKELDGFREFSLVTAKTNNWEQSGKIQEWLNTINEEGKRLDNIRTEDKRILFLKEAHRIYHELLVENNVIDFTTIQREVYRLLHNEQILEKIREKIHYIMIDEYQDTNTIQEKIVFLIGGKRRNICVVGDDDQGIYRFRGATVRNILQFPEKFPEGECKLVALDINYRSHRDIIKFCNRWIKLINWRGYRYDKEIVPPEEKKFPDTSGVIRIGGESEESWKENVYRFLKTLKTTGKIEDYSQVAFLFKSLQKPNVKNLKAYLENSGVPVYSPRSKDYFERIEIRLVIATLLAYFPQTKYLVLAPIDSSGNRVFDYYNDSLNLLKKEIKKDERLHQWLFEKRKENSSETIEYYPSLKRIFYSFLQFDTFKKFIKIESKDSNDGKESYNLGIFTELLEKFEDITKFEDISKADIEKVIKYFFNVYLKNIILKRKEEYEKREEFPKGAILFLTFHQAKGLEFPIVVVGSLDSIPMVREKNEEDILKEYLRIEDNFEPWEKKEEFDFWRAYYTAFSRAKNLLVLISRESRGKKEQPSRVFRPLYESIPYMTDEKFHLNRLEIEMEKKSGIKEIFSYTGDILLYEFCPLKYKMLKEFKFKSLGKPETYYGIFIHKMIEKIHKEAIKSGGYFKDLEEEIKQLGKDLERNLHTKFEIEEYKKVKKQLEIYLEKNSIKELVATELRAYSVEDNCIITGVLDLLRKDGTAIELLDFKSGESSEDKTENYRRQLELYAHLLKDSYEVKELKGKIYYIEEDKEVDIELDENSINKSIEKFKLAVDKILKKEFFSREYGEKCQKCEFKWYCMPKEEKD